ncbi:MAG TPA: GAF domain-containing protein, partial [Bacteroidetes bacterium]|nr:GAF domain-containing protein [Bacteroidota bacterium]
MRQVKAKPAPAPETGKTTARIASRAERDWSSVFYRVALSISRELDLQKLLWLIMDEVRQALEADRCTVFLWDEETDELWALAAHGAEEIRFPASLGIAGHVLRTGEVLNIPDAYSDPRFNPAIDRETGYRTRSILTAPLRNHLGETIGVFQVLNKESGPFTREDELLLDAISGIASTQIENARLYAELKNSFESFVETLASIIDARDPETAGH